MRKTGIIIVILILSGCNNFVAYDTGRPPHSPSENTTQHTFDSDPNITVVGGKIPVDPNVVWSRVQKLHGVSVSPPKRIITRSQNRTRIPTDPFYRKVTGIDHFSVTGSTPSGSVISENEIVIYTNKDRAKQVEVVLAHEFAHIIQYRLIKQQEDTEWLLMPTIFEGAAVYLTDAYIRNFAPGQTLQSQIVASGFNSSTEYRYFRSTYHLGYQYVKKLVDGPTDLPQIYRNPPPTTEHILHYPTKQDYYSPIEVCANQPSNYSYAGAETAGELYLRIVLDSHVSYERAIQGSSGWDGDRVVKYWHNGEHRMVYLWIINWDNSESANEFVEVIRDWLNNRANQNGDYWQEDATHFSFIRDGANRTTLLIGDSRFVTDYDTEYVRKCSEQQT